MGARSSARSAAARTAADCLAPAVRDGASHYDPPPVLYEIVLSFSDRDELRVTDRGPYTVGETIRIDEREWVIVRQERPTDPSAVTRYICKVKPGSNSS